MAVLLLLLVLPARAALQFDAFLGYDGYVPEGSWFPMVFEVKNDGPSFTGVVEIGSAQFSQGAARRLPVELPTGTLKRFVVPVFSTTRYNSTWAVRLLDERGRQREAKPNLQARRLMRWDAVLIGALARTVEGVPVLPQVKPNVQDLQPAAARLQPDLFPDNPIALGGLSAIYLNSEKALSLKVGQANALLSWLNSGGHLIVCVEQPADINANPWLRGILPGEVTGVTTVKLDGGFLQWLRAAPDTTAGSGTLLRPTMPGKPRPIAPSATGNSPFLSLPADPGFDTAELPVATGRIRDGKVVLAAGEVPLMIEANRGRGRVTLLMFSTEREPFRTWKHKPWFWVRLAAIPAVLFVSQDYYNAGGWSMDGVFGSMIDSRQVRKLPVGWLLLLLLFYLAVIGPFDHFLLKRLRRPMLTWITFPAYVVLFSGLIYFIGYKLRAGETEWNELQVVDVLPRGERAELRGRTYASVYSPANASYPLASTNAFATLRGEYLGNWSGAAEGSRATIEQTGNNFRAEASVPVWTIGLYVSDWWQPSEPLVGASVRPDGANWQVTLNNRSPRRFGPVCMVLNGRVHELPDLAAGETVTRSVQQSSGEMLTDFLKRHSGGFEAAVQQRQRALGESRTEAISSAPKSAMAASFILMGVEGRSGYRNFISPPGLDLSTLAERGDAILLAWADDFSAAPPLNQFSPRRSSRQALLRLSVPVQKTP